MPLTNRKAKWIFNRIKIDIRQQKNKTTLQAPSAPAKSAFPHSFYS
jgi:hypothetical protein